MWDLGCGIWDVGFGISDVADLNKDTHSPFALRRFAYHPS